MMEGVQKATVWEAVPEFNGRTVKGRVVVNPPDRRGEVRPYRTLEAWYFCNCGRAYQNVDRYLEHKGSHGGCGQRLSTKKKIVTSITIAKGKDDMYQIVRDSKNNKFLKSSNGHSKGSGVRHVSRVGYDEKPVEAKSKGIIRRAAVIPKNGNTNSNKIGAKLVTKTKGVECNECGKVFAEIRHLRIHHYKIHRQANEKAVVVTPKRPRFKAVVPKRPVQVKGYVLKTQGSLVPVKRCSICNMGFVNKIGYFKHMMCKHEGMNISKCSHCTYATISQDSLENHIKKFHAARPPTFHFSLRAKGEEMDGGAANEKDVDHANVSTENKPGETMESSQSSPVVITDKQQKQRFPKCRWCKRKFTSASRLREHIAKLHALPRAVLRSSTTTVENDTAEKSAVQGEDQNEDASSVCTEEGVGVSVSPEKSKPQCITKDTEPQAVHSMGTCDLEKRLHVKDKSKAKSGWMLDRRKLGRHRFRCYTCDLTFKKKSGLKLHVQRKHAMRKVTGSMRNTAELSSVVSKAKGRGGNSLNGENESAKLPSTRGKPNFRKPADFQRGNSSHNTRRTPFCVLCGKYFLNLKGLERHKQLSHAAGNKYPCRKCRCVYGNQAAVIAHMWHSHREGYYAGLSAKKEDDSVKAEMSEELNTTTSSCSNVKLLPATPDKSFPTTLRTASKFSEHCEDAKKNLGDNLEGKERQKEFLVKGNVYILCSLCGLKVPKTHMDRHKQAAHQGGDFPCDRCPCVFRKNASLRMHGHHMHKKVKQNPSESDKAIAEAEKCSKTPHVAVPAENERPCPGIKRLSPLRSLICPVCKLTVSGGVRGMLQHKQASHAQAGVFTCSACSCAFRDRCSLLLHLTTCAHAEKPSVLSSKGLNKPKGPTESRKAIEEEITSAFVRNLRKSLPVREISGKSCTTSASSDDCLSMKVVSKTSGSMFEEPKEDVPKIVCFFSQNSQFSRKSSAEISPTKVLGSSQEQNNSKSETAKDVARKKENTEIIVAPRKRMEQNLMESLKSAEGNNEVDKREPKKSFSALRIARSNREQAPDSVLDYAHQRLKNSNMKTKADQVQVAGSQAANPRLANQTSNLGRQVRPQKQTLLVPKVNKKLLLPPPAAAVTRSRSEYQLPFKVAPPCEVSNANTLLKTPKCTNVPEAMNQTLTLRALNDSSAHFKSVFTKSGRNSLITSQKPAADLVESKLTDALRSIRNKPGMSVTVVNQDTNGKNATATNSTAVARETSGPGIIGGSRFLRAPGSARPQKASNGTGLHQSSGKTESQQASVSLGSPQAASTARSQLTANSSGFSNKTRLIVCHKCKKSFFSKGRLTEHVKICQVAPHAPSGMKCGYCGRNFNKAALVAHMKECGSKR